MKKKKNKIKKTEREEYLDNVKKLENLLKMAGSKLKEGETFFNMTSEEIESLDFSEAYKKPKSEYEIWYESLSEDYKRIEFEMTLEERLDYFNRHKHEVARRAKNKMEELKRLNLPLTSPVLNFDERFDYYILDKIDYKKDLK